MADYTVKRGDSLWKIAKNYGSRISGNTINAKIDTLVAVNGIKNRNLIYVGQGINFSGSGSTSSSSTSSNTVTITGLGLAANSSKGRDVYACWTWTRDHTKEYKVRWEEYLRQPDGTGYLTWTENTTTTRDSSHTAKDNAEYVQVFVTPISDTYEVEIEVKEEDDYSIGNVTTTTKKETRYYFTDAKETGKQYHFRDNPPLAPSSAPTVEIDNDTLTLTAKYSNIKASELSAVSVKFNVVRDNSTSVTTSGPVTINTTSNYVAWQYEVEPGHTYTVRACCVGSNGKESGWSDFSNEAGTKPSAPAMVAASCRRVKRTDGTQAAHLEWTAVTNATKYKIEYVTTKSDFETTPSNIQQVTTDDARTSIEILFEDSKLGYDYFFRVRAINEEGQGGTLTSDPSDIVEIPIGSLPGPPTTYSSSNSAFVGDDMELNWVHNPTDNSKQSYAELQLNINDSGWSSFTLTNTTDENDTEESIVESNKWKYGQGISYKGTLRFKMDTTHADLENAKIIWRVRTAGVTDQFSDEAWSTERTIYIYEKPTLGLSMTSDVSGSGTLITTLTSFPFYIRGTLSIIDYNIQKPVGYHLRIVANDYYSTVDDVGNTKVINPGDDVYSKYFDTSENPLIAELSASNIDLESGINYTVYCSADMSTGLTIDSQHDFTVSWTDVEYAIQADITVDKESYTALISPYCMYSEGEYSIPWTTGGYVSETDGTVVSETGWLYSDYIDIRGTVFTLTNSMTTNNQHNAFYDAGGTYISGFSNVTGTVTIPTGAKYYRLSKTSDATLTAQYSDTKSGFVEDVTLSVYRREYDGSYKEIATNIPNNGTAVTDPHPALDYARYRLVAKDTETGAISYYDMPGQAVNGSAIILQWAEEWRSFDSSGSMAVDAPPWSGSLLKLPYNIKVTDSRKRDSSLIEYAGRSYPVTYYGTQIDESQSWSVDIPADDKETVYALRRLSLWSGDVYVREPSGMGFWANIEVSFSQSYDEVKIPVTINVTRVEGGV